METVTEGVLRAIVGRALKDQPPPRLIAVAGDPVWDGPDQVEVEGHAVQVVPCISVLAAREVLALGTDRESEKGGITVIVTDRSDRELGEEALASLWRHGVQNPTGWEKVKQLFRVDALDSSLADERWLVELLVRVAPPRGYTPPTSGYLSRSDAWAAYRRHGLRLTGASPTLADLLEWTARDDTVFALESDTADYVEEVRTALAADIGPAAGYVFDLVRTGKGKDCVPLGLVADALWGELDASDPQLLHARVRFEHAAECPHVSSEVVRAWADASIAVLAAAEQRGHTPLVTAWRDRAEELLVDLDAIDLAVGSSVLPQAFELRMIEVGSALRRFLDEADEERLGVIEAALERVERHRLSRSGEGGDRVERARMALRLCRWQSFPRTGANDLGSLARSFMEDGAWVDRARDEVGNGETVFGLYEAYDRLLVEVDAARAERDRAFGQRLASWAKTPGPTSELIRPIERVLDEVVVPIMAHHAVLFLVLDGLSHPEALKLASDIRAQGWKPRSPGGKPLPATVAAFPTVTEVSRTSLLTGTVTRGVAKDEKEGFTKHAGLGAASPELPPVLFHKKELKVEGGQIAPAVRQAVLDPGHRVVGAVVNAVDDHLANGSQLRLAEGLRALRPLRPLLDVAAEADRVVVIVSDHGHILEHGTSVKPHAGAGERWRPADGGPSEGEVRLEGPRVGLGDGAIIVPATAEIRYVAFEKRGYHGGATPQEVLCPLMILFTGAKTIEGWDTLPEREPAWWRSEAAHVSVADTRPVYDIPSRVEPTGQATFLDQAGQIAGTPDQPEWIETLMGTSLWMSQKESAGRAALDDESAVEILMLFEERGGVVASGVLADRLDLSATRARSKLEALRRIVNFDGYGVLQIESDGTGRLDFNLLETQFGVSR